MIAIIVYQKECFFLYNHKYGKFYSSAALFLCYVAINIIVPMQYSGYNIASQTVSELSAIDAPTSAFWSELCIFYIFLFIAFGFGTWLSAHGKEKK